MTHIIDQLKAEGKMAAARASERAVEIATKKAEDAIRHILLSLENDTLCSVDQVNVDTRNFANCAVDIILKR